MTVTGCHINSRLINACLQNAKKKNKNCVIVFLEVSKAFDKIGHAHIFVDHLKLNLVNLIMNLLTQNYVTMTVGKKSSIPIYIYIYTMSFWDWTIVLIISITNRWIMFSGCSTDAEMLSETVSEMFYSRINNWLI